MGSQPERWEKTVEDLYVMPDDGHRYELVGGSLISEPLPGGRHGRVAAKIATLLTNHSTAHRLGVVLSCDTGFILHRSPDTVRGPDVAFVERERYEALADESKAIPGPPDLAVEILSPSNSPADIRGKVADYLAAGTALVWVVDPARESVTTYRTLFEPRCIAPDGHLTAEDLLPGLSLPVSAFFEF